MGVITLANVFDILHERGFIKQTTHEEPLRDLLGTDKITAYVGFDPTADSLHVGHTVAVMALAHLQRYGHRPIAIVGGGTALIGDPSGKSEMRQMLTLDQISSNISGIKHQLSRFIEFGESENEGKALIRDNADWLSKLNYIEFLREVGVHFSVNRMLTAECYRGRMEKGLSFIEFNYMLLQSYDFLHLYRTYGCRLQMGGDDQWSNILSGADLVRRVERAGAFGLTFPLLVTSSGGKMGKTEAGAVWLDPDKTSPFDFYQYWRNTHDQDVERFLAIFTFLPMGEVRRLGGLKDREINEAKKVLAYEVTRLVHGELEATRAAQAADALFGAGKDSEAVPAYAIPSEQLESGISLLDLLTLTGFTSSKGEARRLIQGGGLYINEARVDSPDLVINTEYLTNERISLRKGKKQHLHVIPTA